MADESKITSPESEEKRPEVSKPPEVPIPRELEEIVSKLPDDDKVKVRSVFRSLSISSFGMTEPFFMSKITSDHIDKIIDYQDKQSERQTELDRRDQKQRLHIFYGILCFVVVLIVLFLAWDAKEYLGEIAKIGGGILGGFGLAKVHERIRR